MQKVNPFVGLYRKEGIEKPQDPNPKVLKSLTYSFRLQDACSFNSKISKIQQSTKKAVCPPRKGGDSLLSPTEQKILDISAKAS